MKHITIAAIIAISALSTAHAGDITEGISKSCHEYANDPESCVLIQINAAEFLAPLYTKEKKVSTQVINECAKTMPYPHDWLYVRACVSAKLHEALYQ